MAAASTIAAMPTRTGRGSRAGDVLGHRGMMGGPQQGLYDGNFDGTIDVLDLIGLLLAFGQPCSTG